MKTLFTTLLAFAVLAFTAQADLTIKVSDVHLCCPKCITAAKKVGASVPGVTADVNGDDGTITLTGPDAATLQKSADAYTDAGFYGTTTDATVKLSTATGAKGVKVSTLTVTGVHLCCGKCVKAVNEALATVPGVKANTAAKGVKSFEVTGDFTDSDVFAALQKIGLTGKAE